MKVFGGILLFLGVILSFVGYNQMNSLEAKVGRFMGHSDPTGGIMIALGIGMGIVGIIFLLKKNNNEKNKVV